MNEEITTPEIEILTMLNDLAGKRFKPIKSNIAPISARLKDGYTVQELKEIVQVKTLDWKNNEVMNQHLCPTTLFRPGNTDKYLNYIVSIKANPKQYAKYFAKLNKTRSSANRTDDLTDIYGD
ncbi:MAG: conserved phage C-terminal domain-containing protein [Weeksellaceae bacterium]|nr:conserved phage C-terminal domain-containing protein [Bacteroidota bacterium]MCG2780764.1 conserved phage C-terminal domain-containing protein [Weeksellaceae bacterium]